jgi:von Willebrand factor type A domain
VWSSRLRRFWLRRSRGVDTHDADAFPGPARRTWALRTVSVGAAVALLLAAASSARDLETRERGLLPTGTIGVVVVDLSLSIAEEDYFQVRSVLRRLIAEDARIGLVFFSDVPYELLPPGTPAAELKPMLRLLVPPELGPPVNPWAGVFRAGTRISPALQLAKEMLERERVRNASILLVSDLETAPDDVPALVRTLQEIRATSIALRVSALAPSSDARLIFEDFVQKGAFSLPSEPGLSGEETRAEESTTTALPVALLVLGALFFLALAAHEGFTGRLGLPAARRARRPA